VTVTISNCAFFYILDIPNELITTTSTTTTTTETKKARNFANDLSASFKQSTQRGRQKWTRKRSTWRICAVAISES